MKILLIDYDGKDPNLALMKLSTWHKQQDDEVYLNRCDKPDKVYISTLFTWNKPKVKELLRVCPNAEVGGFGWDFITKGNKLIEERHTELPPEIEALKPDYDLYTVTDIYERIKFGIGTKKGKLEKAETIVNAGIGFTSRGCVNSCGFCGVPKKEGKLRQVGNIGDLINPKSNVIILLDNNLTADPDCIDKLHEIRDRGLIVDITQGVDVRLITPEIAQALSEVKHLRSVHYAWDLMPFEQQIMRGIEVLSESIKRYRHMCYILIGFNTTFEEDMYRFRRLREIGVDPYVMPYNLSFPSEKHHHFARWVNGRIYTKCHFDEYGPWIKAQAAEGQLSMV